MASAPSKPKILIVDDIAENLIALQMLLKKIDVEVVKAQSGKAALEATLNHDFNLVLLDVMMPGMDGYEVAEFLHNNDKTAHIPIIFISAMDKSEAHESHGYSKGAVDFLFKPINEVILLSKIKVHLELQKKQKFIRHSLDNYPVAQPKILIVDDNPENLFALEKILGKLDAEVVSASSGNEALSATLYNEFALIILDIKMPGMDGYEVAEILKFDERTDNIPIIFVTVLDGDDEKEIKGYQKGAVDYIIKPFNAFILLSKVKVFLDLFKIKTALENLVSERNKDLEEANAHLSHHNKRLRAIVTTINKITSHDYLSSTGNIILEKFAEHMEATGGSLYIVEEQGLRLMHSIDSDHAEQFLSFPLVENSILQRTINCGQPFLSEDIRSLGNIKPSGWQGYTSNSILIFPLLENDNKIIAILALHNKRTPPFTSHDLEIGNILSSYVSETLKGRQFQEALLESQKQYQALFEKANDGFFIIDRESGNIMDANRAALEICGYGSQSIKEMRFDSLIVAPKKRVMDGIATSEVAKDLGQVTIKTKAGEQRTIQLNLVPLDTSNSICMAKDITSKLETERQLSQAQKMESLGTLSGGIAHDFNNLLTPILGHSDLLLQGIPEGEKSLFNVQEINRAAKRAKELVKQILTFSHQETSGFRQLPLKPIVEEALQLVSATLPSTISVEKKIRNCGAVNADSTLIHQIVMNLSTNAYHAMKEKGGVLNVTLADITLSSTDSDLLNVPSGNYVNLTISDTGKGMDKLLMEKIFDPFFTTKEKGEGTGMGLSVVHGIMNKIGGVIQVESDLEQGSCFSLYFPHSKEQKNIQTTETTAHAKHVNDKERILFVDDDDANLVLIKEMLELDGYKVTTFNRSMLALEEFKKNSSQYNLVITDLTMPQMTGDILAREFEQIAPHIPILILTGFSGNLPKDRQQGANIMGFMDKPIDRIKFISKIREVLAEQIVY